MGAISLAYDHADWLVPRSIARYVDLSPAQKDELNAHFERLHGWHRANELPLYADVLDQASQRVGRGLTRDDVVWMLGTVTPRRQAGAAHIAAELAPMLVRLTPEQQAEIADNLAKDQAKFVKTQLGPDPDEVQRERTDWLTKQVERWTGSLTSQQRARVAAVALATPEFPAARAAERRRRQIAFLELIGRARDESSLRSGLERLLSSPRTGADTDYQRAVAHYEDQLTDMILDLDHSLSARQRATAVDRLQRYAAQFRELAVQRDK